MQTNVDLLWKSETENETGNSNKITKQKGSTHSIVIQLNDEVYLMI